RCWRGDYFCWERPIFLTPTKELRRCATRSKKNPRRRIFVRTAKGFLANTKKFITTRFTMLKPTSFETYQHSKLSRTPLKSPSGFMRPRHTGNETCRNGFSKKVGSVRSGAQLSKTLSHSSCTNLPN